eukprot:jgi/Mesvir1/1847/Mv26368-RA.1
MRGELRAVVMGFIRLANMLFTRYVVQGLQLFSFRADPRMAGQNKVAATAMIPPQSEGTL